MAVQHTATGRGGDDHGDRAGADHRARGPRVPREGLDPGGDRRGRGGGGGGAALPADRRAPLPVDACPRQNLPSTEMRIRATRKPSAG